MLITSLNIAVCATALTAGIYTFAKHLNAFNHGKTPFADAWLTAVGTLGWSVLLYASLDEHGLTAVDVFGHALLLIFWVGNLLKVQKYGLRFRKRFLRSRPN